MNYWKAWTRKRTRSVTLVSLFAFLYLHRHCQASSAGEFPIYIYTASGTSNGSSSSDDELEISSDFEDVSVVMQWSDDGGSGAHGADNHIRDVPKPRTNEFPESLSADASSGQTGDDNATTYRDGSSQKPLQTLQKLQQMLDETDYMTVSPKSKAGLQKPQTSPKSLYQNDSIPRKQDQQEQGQKPEDSAFQDKLSQSIDTPAQQQRQKQEQRMVEKSPNESLKRLEKNQKGINHIVTSPPMSTESIRQDQLRKQHEQSLTTSNIIKKTPQMIPKNLSQEKQQRRPRHPSSPLQVEPLWTSKDRSKYKKMQQMQRRAQDERRRLAQLRYLEELQHQTTSEDESTDATEGDTDDSIPSYTLPNLPIYMSDAEGEGSDSEHYYGSTSEQTSGRNPQTFEQQRQRATAVQQAVSSVPPRPPYGYPPIYQPPILPNQQQQQQQQQQQSTTLSLSSIMSSMRHVFGSPIFWLVGLGHTISCIGRRSDQLLGDFFQSTADLPSYLCGGLTSSMNLGFILGLLWSKDFPQLSNQDKGRFLRRRYLLAGLSALALALCAALPPPIQGWTLASLIFVASCSLASSISFIFYQIPATTGTLFGTNQAVCVSFLDGMGFFLCAPILLGLGQVIHQFGWTVAWTIVAGLMGIASTFMMKALPVVFDFEGKKKEETS